MPQEPQKGAAGAWAWPCSSGSFCRSIPVIRVLSPSHHPSETLTRGTAQRPAEAERTNTAWLSLPGISRSIDLRCPNYPPQRSGQERCRGSRGLREGRRVSVALCIESSAAVEAAPVSGSVWGTAENNPC